jgi:DNA-directed RNA polymerase subunit RPC12/RpoP
MEIRDPEKMAAYIAAVQKEPGVLVRLREDGTVDLTFSAEKRLEPAIERVSCPYCAVRIREHQERLEDTIRGMYLRCPSCGQRFFVHLYVPFGGTTA